MQLKFSCKVCGLAGLTPEVTVQQAVSLAQGQARLRCPRCSSILSMQTNAVEALAGTEARSLSQVLEEALKSVLGGRGNGG